MANNVNKDENNDIYNCRHKLFFNNLSQVLLFTSRERSMGSRHSRRFAHCLTDVTPFIECPVSIRLNGGVNQVERSAVVL